MLDAIWDVALVLDADQRVVLANAAARRVLGAGLEGRTLASFADRAWSAFARSAHGGGPQQIRAGVVELRAAPWRAGVLLVAHEVDEVALAERRCRATLDRLPHPVVTIDVEGHITYLNPAGERALERTASHALGERWSELVPESLPLETGVHEARSFVQLLETSGGTRVLAWTDSPVYDDRGEILEHVAIGVDVTDHRAREEALRASLAENEQLLRELHHRVKNNLQMVTSLLSLRLGTIDDREMRATVDDVRARVHAMALLHEHLYRSRELGVVESVTYLGGLVQALERSTGRPEVIVTTRIDLVTLDVEQAVALGTCVHELLSNAFRHGFPRGAAGRVLVELRREESELCLCVEDDGIGRAATAAGDGRLGMGLTIAKSLARSRRGTLAWIDRPRGVRVEVCFPCG